MSEKEQVTLTKQDLADLVTAAIKAAKEPTAAEQRKLDKEEQEFKEAQKDRAQIGLEALKLRDQKLDNQRLCSHEHPNGTSHCVYIMEPPPSPGYLLCQKFQCKIRPEPRPEKGFDPDAIYDTAQFNKIFQKLQSGAGDIIA